MIVAHLDLDAFFAAVEELEDPSLRERLAAVDVNHMTPMEALMLLTELKKDL